MVDGIRKHYVDKPSYSMEEYCLLGSDAYPVFRTERNTVYYGYVCDVDVSDMIYSNIPTAGAAKPGHTADDDGDCTTEDSCLYCSAVATEAREAHEQGADDGDCTTAVTCLYCDHVCVEAKAEHTFGEWTVTKEASVTEKGSRSQSCDCGYTVTEEIPILEIDEEPAADATVSDDTIAEPDDTAAENGDETVEDSDATAEEGCGSALIGTPLVLLALIGTAGTVLLKKTREA